MYKRNNRGEHWGIAQLINILIWQKGYKKVWNSQIYLASFGWMHWIVVGETPIRASVTKTLSWIVRPRNTSAAAGRKKLKTLPLVGSKPPPVHVSTRNITCSGSGIPTNAFYLPLESGEDRSKLCRWWDLNLDVVNLLVWILFPLLGRSKSLKALVSFFQNPQWIMTCHVKVPENSSETLGMCLEGVRR